MVDLDGILEEIDDTPYGCRVIAEKDRCLGLTAFMPSGFGQNILFDPDNNYKQKSISKDKAAETVYEPYLKKSRKEQESMSTKEE